MANFQYKGRSTGGQVVEGVIEAVSVDAVVRQLSGAGVTPVKISESSDGSDPLEKLNRWLERSKPSLEDLIMFSRQMFTLTKAGIPLGRAIRGLSDTTRNIVLAEALGEIARALESGRTLSQSMRRFPEVFPSLYVSLVQVGEDSGQLDQSFFSLGVYLERDRETASRVKEALRYPVTVLGAIGIALVLINIFVIPQFAKIFEGFGADLPLATQILMGTSKFMVEYWPLLLAGMVGAMVGWRKWLATPTGCMAWDKRKLKLPIVGPIILRAVLGRFCRSFALVLRSGMPFLDGLQLVSQSAGNAWIADKLQGMTTGIQRGESLTRAARSTDMFTPLVIQMLSVGEETGTVEDLLQEVAEYYDREVDEDLKGLSAAIEPILLVGIGIIVLVLALGVFLPMWDLSSAAQGG